MKMEENHGRIVLVPAPFQGHLNPMLQLATLLHSKGFSITIAHSTLISPTNPNFTFLPIPDGFSSIDASSMFFIDFINEINIRSETPLHEKLGVEMKKCGGITCLIYDPVMYGLEKITSDLGMPSIVFETLSTAILVTNTGYPQFQEQGYIPLHESRSRELLPTEYHPFRFKDLPIYNLEYYEAFLEMIAKFTSIKTSCAWILNTVDCLEHSFLSKLKQLKHPNQVFAIGPLHKITDHSYASSTSLWKEDKSCIEWLNTQAPNSVIYVSTGSLSEIDNKELKETAWGLANSEQPFLWVIRPGSTKEGEDWMSQLSGINFKEVVEKRGCVVEWAPQKDVLAHEATGGFLSHCGWNSTMESLSVGVPMICYPRSVDQRMNTRYVSHVWRAGIELEEMERGEIEKAVMKLMVGKESEEMRDRALDLKMEIEVATKEGGSSFTSINNLVEFILGFVILLEKKGCLIL